MAIAPELQTYGSEDGFTRSFLVPLLGRLGFSLVVDFHGKREFGKDLIIGEIDPFGHVLYHGVQAKYLPAIGKVDSHALVQDCNEAFAKDFDHPQTGAKHRISRFYVLNAGTISDEAREFFFASLVPAYGDNVRLLGGKELLDIDRLVSVRSEAARDLLSGIVLEARSNLAVLGVVTPVLKGIVAGDGIGVVYPRDRLRTISLTLGLQRPSTIPPDLLGHAFDHAAAFNRSLDNASTSPLHTVVSIKVPAHNALSIIDFLTPELSALQAFAEKALAELGPIAPL